MKETTNQERFEKIMQLVEESKGGVDMRTAVGLSATLLGYLTSVCKSQESRIEELERKVEALMYNEPI